jgi:hypothetical protein
MDNQDRGLIEDFQKESLSLIEKMNLILEQCEDDIRLAPGLEEYGQLVDRIMGGSQSLVMGLDSHLAVVPVLEQIGNYAAVCKAVGYKTSQLRNRPEFYNVCIAFLMDATEVLQNMTEMILNDTHVFQFDQTFINRLKWVSEQFGGEFRSSVAVKQSDDEGRMTQKEIDDLLKKLGLH